VAEAIPSFYTNSNRDSSSMEPAHMDTYDIVVVGAGVVGSSLALMLAKEHQRRVAIIGMSHNVSW
jgi:tRNA A37 threonylcarbamoyladenosine dehydratase